MIRALVNPEERNESPMTNRKSIFLNALILTACALLAVPALAQHDHGGDAGEAAAELPESFSEPMPLYETALGDHHHHISSENEKAQAWFDQGFRLMYAFGKDDAVRSFRESWKQDPDCAICYWGEAWAWGSYLNGPMRPFEAPHAYAAMQEAVARVDGATEKERAYIEAIATRYVEDFDPETRRDQDAAYAEAMRKLSAAYPDDLDAVTLYGDALFLLEPRRGTRDLNDPNVQRLHGVLESVLESGHHAPGRLPPLHPRDRVDGRPRPGVRVRRAPGERDSGGQPHQPHAVAHLERDRPLGRRRPRQPGRMALRPQGGGGRGRRHLPDPQPPHAALRGVDGRAGRHRDLRQARTTPS